MNYPWLDEFMLSKKGIIKEFKAEWGVYRFMLKDKVVGVYSTDTEKRNVITLKCEPKFGAVLRESFKDVRPGYHMNKVHWNSVDLDGDTPDDILKQMIDNCYDLIFASYSIKVQNEIMSE